MSRIFTLNRWYVLSLVLFALGLMAKPMLVTLPFVLLLLDFWPLGRPVRRRLAGLLAEKIPFLALAAAASWVTYLAQERGGAVGLMEAHHLAVRLANALLSYVRYLGAFLWPSGLAVFYPFPSSMPPAPKLAGAALFLVVAGFATVRLARRLPAALTGWLWYLGMLVPVLGLVQVGTQAMADRYTYLPGIGLALALSWGLAALTAARPRWRPAVLMLAAVVLVVLVVLGAATRRQAAFWRNDTTLFAHAVVVVGGNPMAHQNLGAALFREGRAAEAEETFRKVLEADPGNAGAHYNLGVIAEAGGRTAEAADHYRRALATNPEDPEAHNNLGTLLAESGDLPGAVDHYRHALRLKPGFAEAHYNLGIDLLALGRRDEGLGHLRQALRLRPDYPDAAARLARETATGVRVDSVP